MPGAARVKFSDPVEEISEKIKDQLRKGVQDSPLYQDSPLLTVTAGGELDMTIMKVNIVSPSDKRHWTTWIRKHKLDVENVEAEEIGALGIWLIREGIPDISKHFGDFIAIDVFTGYYCVDKDEEKSFERLYENVAHPKIYVIRVESDADLKSK